MHEIQELDRSLVAVFDIEGFSKGSPELQVDLIKTFIKTLEANLNELEDIHPDSFSTGDGAIVSIGRECRIDKRSVKLFLDFVVEFVAFMLNEGLILRTAVNYSEKDKVLILKNSKFLQGKYIQIGDTINDAARIITFCEPGEVMIGKSVQALLRKVGLDKSYKLFENSPLITKHNQVLHTFSYIPAKNERIYNPISPSQFFKKYNCIPSIKSSILNYFRGVGLDFELKKMVSSAYDSVIALNKTMKFFSWNNIINVLIQLKYDPDDTVYVLSRNDRASGFWTQPRKNKYIRYLTANANQYGRYINQTRVIVYNDEDIKFLPEDDIVGPLEKLHNNNTFFFFPSSMLFKYEKLNDLIFGFTVSKKHKYAIIAIPAPQTDHNQAKTTENIDNIEELLKFYEGYDVKDGPMRAIITADSKYVENLIKEMESILEDPQIYRRK